MPPPPACECVHPLAARLRSSSPLRLSRQAWLGTQGVREGFTHVLMCSALHLVQVYPEEMRTHGVQTVIYDLVDEEWPCNC